jgi:hypothetical protein
LEKGIFRDVLVGQFDIDISKIYLENDNHAILHQWVALNKPDSSNPSAVKGYIRASIAV